MNFEEAIEIVIKEKGIDSQYIALSEEAGELLVASSHRRRKRIPREKLIEEMVDVQMMIDEFKVIEKVTPEEFDKMFKKKLKKFYSQVSKFKKQ
jgi:hypothetical protein